MLVARVIPQNGHAIVAYQNIQFTKAPNILLGMGWRRTQTPSNIRTEYGVTPG